MSAACVLAERSGAVTVVTLNRPERRNGVTIEMCEQLHRTLLDVAASDARVVVLRGAGDHFSVGADLGGGQAPTGPRTLERLGPVYHAATLLHTMPQVTLAAIDGGCAGAAMGWACACDVRFASDRARFNTAFLAVGVSGDMGLAWSLPRLVGAARAREMLFFPEKFSAVDALNHGLVTRLFPADSLHDEALAAAAELADRHPFALRMMKANVLSAETAGLGAYVEIESARHLHVSAGASFARVPSAAAPVTTVPEGYAELAAMPAREMSMGLALSWQAARNPDRPALTMGDATLTRLALDRAANRLARALAGRGIGRDDRVAVVLPTGPRHQITCHALWKLGALVMPLPPTLVDEELRHLAALGDPKLVIGVEADRLPGYDTLAADEQPDPALPDTPLPEVVSTMWKASTSGGSTGQPKLIWENKSSLIHPERPIPILDLQVDDVLLHPAGAYHNAAFSQTNWSLCWGSHVVLMDRFDARRWLDEVQRHRVRWAYMVPTMMSRVLALPEDVRAAADLSSLEVVIHMAAPCPPWVKQAWIDWVGPQAVREVYAGTEGFGATMIDGVEWLAHRGSVGKAPHGTEIHDDDGTVLPTGVVGTVWMRPPPGNPFGHPDEPRTYGDLGSVDADGYLYLSDRRTDMILTAGVNLYPAEIEAALERAPGVVAAAVVGLPDPDLGARAHAILELQPGHPAPGPEELAAFLGTHLSRPKLPYTYEVATAPLRDEAGKLRRTRLREERLVVPRHTFQALR